jgi:hypothetical protein
MLKVHQADLGTVAFVCIVDRLLVFDYKTGPFAAIA